MCGKKGRRSKAETWCCHEELKEAILKKKYAYKVRPSNSIENRNRHKSVNNKAKKVISKAMREKCEEVLTELTNCLNGMFILAKEIKIDSKEVK